MPREGERGELRILDEQLSLTPSSFTGSTRVGKILQRQCSEGGIIKRASLELGGNAPFVVFEVRSILLAASQSWQQRSYSRQHNLPCNSLPTAQDADLDVAVKAAMGSKFRNAGQTCVCSDRFLVHESVEEAFLEKLIGEVKKLRMGDGLVPGTTMGPLITSTAAGVVKKKVEDAVSGGSEVLVGGDLREDLGANFFSPTVLRGAKPSDDIFKVRRGREARSEASSK